MAERVEGNADTVVYVDDREFGEVVRIEGLKNEGGFIARYRYRAFLGFESHGGFGELFDNIEQKFLGNNESDPLPQ